MARAARLADALPNMDFVTSCAYANDLEPHVSFLREFQAMMLNTEKPLFITAEGVDDTAVMYEIACALRGSAEALAAKPYFIVYYEPVSPLQHSDDALAKLLFSAERNLRATYIPAPLAAPGRSRSPASSRRRWRICIALGCGQALTTCGSFRHEAVQHLDEVALRPFEVGPHEIARKLGIAPCDRSGDGPVDVAEVAVLDRQGVPLDAGVHGVVPGEEAGSRAMDSVEEQRVAGGLAPTAA